VAKKVMLLGNHGFVIYNFRKELIKELLKEGYEVYISLPYDEKVEIMKSWGCHYIETKVDRRGINPIKDFMLLMHYFFILIKIKPKAVLSYTIKPNLYGGIACRLLKIPNLKNITGLGSGFAKGKLFTKFLVFLYRISHKDEDITFFQNQEDMTALVDRRIIKENYQLIPGSGVNLAEYEFKSYPNDKNSTFLFIGRIMKEKGIDHFLEAAKFIKKKYPNTNFEVIGFVEDTDLHYKELLKELHDDGFIRYLGYQNNVIPFIENAHCLIQPSYSEGLSNVLLESAAIGRALIASDIHGCKETIDEGENGFTFEVKNTNHLIGQIENFLSLSQFEKELMGLHSRKKIENEFDRRTVVSMYMKKIRNY
jgi:galacturonosyltransferase